ncbi:Sodium/calcium exchanger protein-domain-containing protein [Podospora fimiseda]|uniref:Sodium/calcium exchanger protein-domain-containing protein n=1 Tax=Podospora fimiseda TaxID=252190 RepID=A0AAN7BNX3_9PEZI|nr:Sodium/calcium exchanger protein-domain-containing protein [Podospora fimiseda]
MAQRLPTALRAILGHSWLNVGLVFVPAGIIVHALNAPAGVIFTMNALAIVPLAGLLSHATESIASKMGDAVGALMNVTFGNAVELIIFIIALIKNQIRIVQASLVGSILANLLLILGMCFLLGGLKFDQQAYNKKVTHTSASLLALSVVSFLLPTVFHVSFSKETTANSDVLKISRGTSIILLLVYLLYLVFQLKTHTDLYESTAQHIIDEVSRPGPAAQIFHNSSVQETSEEDDEESSPARRRQETSIEMQRISSAQAEPSSSGPNGSDEQSSNEATSTAPANNPGPRPCHQARHTVANFDIEAQELPPTLPPVPAPGRPLSWALTFRNLPFLSPHPTLSRRQSVAASASDTAASQRRQSVIICPPLPLTRKKTNNPISRKAAAVLLILTTCLVSLHAEYMISSIDDMLSTDPGLSEAFIGLILLPIVGNAAEHVTAVSVALKNKMDLAIGVAVGSSIQIALFITPLVVLLGWVMGKEMSLLFTLFETVCVVVSAFIVNFLVLDGRSNYLQGALLCAGYVIIAVAVYFYPDEGAANSLGNGMEIAGSS